MKPSDLSRNERWRAMGDVGAIVALRTRLTGLSAITLPEEVENDLFSALSSLDKLEDGLRRAFNMKGRK